MSTTVLDARGGAIDLKDLVAEGGEGAIWRTGTPGRLLKLYHRPTPERAAKLEAMLANRPADPSTHLDRPAIAWPEALVYDARGTCIGFEMREAKDARTLPSVYLPALRKAKGLDVDWRYLHAVAYNVAVIMRTLHQHGYVIGDLKPQNLLADARANVTIIDTDSFQVGPHRCPVGSDGFTPPELIGQELAEVDQAPAHDRFRLGVLVYLLLFGRHPFQGVWQDDDDPPPLGAGPWCHARGGKLLPPPGAPDLAVVGPELAGCFTACFEAPAPGDRPEAGQWAKALRHALGSLTRCERDRHYQQAGGSCPWCAASSTSGLDVFARPTLPVPAGTTAVPSGRPFQLTPDRGKREADGELVPVMPDLGAIATIAVAWNAFVLLMPLAMVPQLHFVDAADAWPAWAIGPFGLFGILAIMLWRAEYVDGRRWVNESVVLPGVMEACQSTYDDEDGQVLTVTYAFVSPSGQLRRGTETLKHYARQYIPPTPGTPLAIAYINDEKHQPL